MADTKRAALRIRMTGWALVLAGGAAVLFSGGYSPDDPWPFAGGVFGMVAGMILTSVAGLLGLLSHRRRLAEMAEERAREARGGK